MYFVSDELRINSPDLEGAALLTSQSAWGILRGLETFSQLLSLDDTGTVVSVSDLVMYRKSTHNILS
jgi:hypothetical protein